MDNQNLFHQTHTQIVNKMLGSGTKHFQMLGNPQSFNWPVPSPGQLSPQAYQLMSAAPTFSDIGEFSGVGTSRLFDNYKQVFGHVGFNSSSQHREQIKRFSNEINHKRQEIVGLYSQANSAYQTAKQNGGVFFSTHYPAPEDWFKGPGSSYIKQIDTINQNIQEKLGLQQSLNQANQPTSLRNALKLMQLPSWKPSDGNVPRGWAVVPDGQGNLRWQPDFKISTVSQDWRDTLSKGSEGQQTFSLSASNTSDSEEKSWAGGKISYKRFFWGANAQGSWSETNISKSDKSVTATIKVQSSTTVLITPGDWYDGGFLKQLRSAGNSGTGFQILDPYTVMEGPHALFGPNGLCSTMVTGLVVVYKPSFEVNMQSDTYKEHEEKISASVGFRIGPFSFGGSGGHYEKQVKTEGNRTTFSGGSTSTDPLIIGVTLGFPGIEGLEKEHLDQIQEK